MIGLNIGYRVDQTTDSFRNYEFSGHAEDERQAERISIADVEAALLNGELLEDYPNDPRGPSCLVLGYGIPGYPIHVVCGQTPFKKSQAYYGLYSISTQMG
jgi:Domain of unknown function (DUF4258)